ncbi:unnamed protein product [Rhodiola kirilowii]
MASALLMAANPLNWKRMSSILHRPISHATYKSQLVFIRKPENTRPSSFNLKCVVFSKQLPNNTASSNKWKVSVSRNPIMDAILMATAEVLPAAAAVAVLIGLLSWSMYDPQFAPSGGRIGGSRISSVSSLSSSTSHDLRSSCCRCHSSNGDDVMFVGILQQIGVFMICFIIMGMVLLAEKTSVMKLQIVLSGMSRSSLQKELKCIAEVAADTSTPKGLLNVLTATILFLLQHSNHCISGVILMLMSGANPSTIYRSALNGTN